MGGEGSGRKPTISVVNNLISSNTPKPTDNSLMVLPNYSGIKKEALKTDPTDLSGGGGGDSNWTLNGDDIYNNNSGNVGIGTETPEDKLHINVGEIVESGDTNNEVSGYYGLFGIYNYTTLRVDVNRYESERRSNPYQISTPINSFISNCSVPVNYYGYVRVEYIYNSGDDSVSLEFYDSEDTLIGNTTSVGFGNTETITIVAQNSSSFDGSIILYAGAGANISGSMDFYWKKFVTFYNGDTGVAQSLPYESTGKLPISELGGSGLNGAVYIDSVPDGDLVQITLTIPVTPEPFKITKGDVNLIKTDIIGRTTLGTANNVEYSSFEYIPISASGNTNLNVAFQVRNYNAFGNAGFLIGNDIAVNMGGIAGGGSSAGGLTNAIYFYSTGQTGSGVPMIFNTEADASITFSVNNSPRMKLQSDTEGGKIFFTATPVMSDGINIEFGTTTGTIIGSANTQLLSFWGATPIVQPDNTITDTTTLVGGAGTGLTDTDTWDGYTIGQIVTALKTAGLLA